MQTFTEKVKEEICDNIKESNNNKLLFWAILLIISEQNNLKNTLKLTTKYIPLIKFFKTFTNLNQEYEIQISLNQTNKLQAQKTFYDVLFIDKTHSFDQYIKEFKKIVKTDPKQFYQFVLIAFFLILGSISDPKRSYHLEFRVNNSIQKTLILKALSFFQLDYREIEYRHKTIVYFKKIIVISDLLKILTANKAMFFLEDNRISRDMVNNIQRLVNLDICNLNKMTKSAVEQSKMCQIIQTSIYYQDLSYKEKIYCDVRAKSPNINMQAICDIMNQIDSSLVIKKGSLCHIVKKIKSIYTKI